MIENLPENFPAAAGVIKSELAPALMGIDKGLFEHYCVVIKKRTNASSTKAVVTLIGDAIRQFQKKDVSDPPSSASIVKEAALIARDPQIFKKKIDAINRLGVLGERRNIALILATIDSRLLPLKNGKPENLGMKTSGYQGSGKSNQMEKALKIYPETAYHILSNVSPKGLMMMEDKLKNKAVVFSEAKTFESRGKTDPEQAYIVRSLLSEGVFEYQRQKNTKEGCIKETLRLEGPISLLTTTISEKLEQQLEDRIFTIHTDTHPDQTRKVLEQMAVVAANLQEPSDENLIKTLQHFHDALESFQVIIPYATDIASLLPKDPLPVSARRAFARVLAVIKTMTILYQSQRETDEYGHLIAEYADYAMAYQLVKVCFAESAKTMTLTEDKRIKIIESEGMITQKALTEKCGVSNPVISEWVKSAVRAGMVIRCDRNGDEFKDVASLDKARYCGNLYLRLAPSKNLPTPFELTGDSRWEKGGDLFSLYDLQLSPDGE